MNRSSEPSARLHRTLRCLALPLCISACSTEQPPADPDTTQPTRCGDYSALKNAYFGDLHTHTSYSLDAYTVATRADPAAAYAFAAKMEPVTIASGSPNGAGPTTTIDRKLDFLAVTDHSEFFQADYGCTVDSTSPYYGTTFCQALRNQGSLAQATAAGTVGAQVIRANPSQPALCKQAEYAAACQKEESKAWQEVQRAAKAANNPCTFTSFMAFEWTNSLNQLNLHRNVIFKSEAVTPLPLDYLSYPTTSELWTALDRQCTNRPECDALTIPHNSNASGGQMFVFSAAEVPQMQRYQTLTEIHQHKGNSECLSDTSDTGQVSACTFEVLPGSTTDTDRPGYVRSALESGLSYYATNKQNPLQLGLVGATDTHNSTPGHVKEEGWPGHLGITDDTAQLRVAQKSAGNMDNANRNFNPGAITGAWAEENTRESIFAAFKRREVFATSGPRIRPRFYGFSGQSDPCADASFPAQVVQAGGVPMGGTIKPQGTPRFVVSALKDQTDLAQVDIIKASVVGGQVQEKVYSIPLGGKTCVTWSDPAFNAAAPAFYYARVLEQPTWRWSHYDCQTLKAQSPNDWLTIAPGCDPQKTQAQGGLDYKIQERAWTSPVFSKL